MEISKRKNKVREVILEIFIAFIILVVIFELFDNDRLLVLNQLSLGNNYRLYNSTKLSCFSLVIFGLLFPITVVNLVNTMWKQRIPVDRRDHIRVGSLLVLFIFQHAISNLNNEEKEFIWKISRAVGSGSLAYLLLGDKNLQNVYKNYKMFLKITKCLQ